METLLRNGEEKLPEDLKNTLAKMALSMKTGGFAEYADNFAPSTNKETIEREKAWFEEGIRGMETEKVEITSHGLAEILTPSLVRGPFFFYIENRDQHRMLSTEISFQRDKGRWVVQEKTNKGSTTHCTLHLHTEETEAFDQLEIIFEGFRIKMKNGYITPGYVREEISALALIGKGELTSHPPTHDGRRILLNSTGKDNMKEAFSAVWIRISEKDYQDLVKTKGNKRTKVSDALAERAKEIMEKCWKKSYHQPGSPGWTLPLPQGSYVADILTETMGWVHYFHQPTATEASVQSPGRLLWGSQKTGLEDTVPHRPIDIEHYDIHLSVKDDQIKCEVSTLIRFLDPAEDIVLGLNPSLQIDGIWDQEEQELGHTQGKERWEVVVQLRRRARRGERTVIKFIYHGPILITGDQSTAFKVWDKVSKEITWLRMESAWYPINGYDDLATSEIEIIVPPGMVAVCTGKQVGEEKTEQRWTTRWQTSNPTRIIATAIAQYQAHKTSFTEEEKARYGMDALELYTTPKLSHKAESILEKAIDILSFYTEKFGPLPHPKLAIVEIGQEYQGGYGPPSLVMTDPTLKELAHEMAHQWWGTSLSEALAQYSALLYSEAKEDPRALTEGLAGLRRTAIKYSVVEPISQKMPYTGYTPTVRFFKGIWVIHMLRLLIGDETFFAGLRKIVERHHSNNLWLFRDTKQLEAVGPDQMQTAFEEAWGKDLGPFFDFWFRNTTIPQIHTEWNYTRCGGGYRVTTKVQSSHACHAIMPIEILTTKSSVHERILTDSKLLEATCKVKNQPTDIIFNKGNLLLAIRTP